jgi:hypothetical protein
MLSKNYRWGCLNGVSMGGGQVSKKRLLLSKNYRLSMSSLCFNKGINKGEQ